MLLFNQPDIPGLGFLYDFSGVWDQQFLHLYLNRVTCSLEIVTHILMHEAVPDIVADALSVPFSGQPLNSETMQLVETAIPLCMEYLLLEQTRVHGTRNNE